MKKLINIYKPFHYSNTQCFIITLNITRGGYYKIEQKLPAVMKTVKAVFVSASSISPPVMGLSLWQYGFISFGLNEGQIKCYQRPVIDISRRTDCPQPQELNEPVKDGSLLQGYYQDMARTIYPYTVKIYLHYTS